MKNCSLLVLINIPRGYLPKQQHRPSTVCHPPGSAYFIPNLRLMEVLMIKTAIIIKGLSRSPSNGAFPSRRAIIKLGYRRLIMSHGILTERMTTLWLWYLAYKIRFYSLFQPRDRPLHNIIILPREPSPIGTYILAISSSWPHPLRVSINHLFNSPPAWVWVEWSKEDTCCTLDKNRDDH